MADKKTMTLFNYIGGKTWMKNHLREAITNILSNNKITTYVEPFAGGLGAFLSVYDILLENNIKKVILNDINSRLINFYNIVKNHPEELIKEYVILENQYSHLIPEEAKSLHKTKDKKKLKSLLYKTEEFYKNVRNNFNSKVNDLDSAVYLLFLQHHCFNGVYRENSTGGYNTPFNWEVKIFDEKKIKSKINAVHDIFKNFEIDFLNKSFQNLDYNNETLYYIDPPYINGEETIENKYNKDSFGFEMQKLLIKTLIGTHFLYSNHENQLLIDEFNKNKMTINVKKIPRKNIISASNESRKTDKIEILVSSL